MKMNQLGRTGIAVSEICLGTMTFGEQNNETESHRQIDLAVEAGVNFIDTAEMYPTNPRTAETQGRTEEIVGTWLEKSGRRGDVVVATKITGDGLGWIRDGAPFNRASIIEAVESSLDRLRTDHIDLYQFHWPNRGSMHFRQNWNFDATKQDRALSVDNMLDCLRGIDDLVKAGKIGAFGLSNESSWGVMEFVRLAETNNLPRVASIQNEYSLMCRHFDMDLAEISHHEDVGLLAYSPLATGLLTGKYRNDALPEGSRRTRTPDLGGRYTPQAQAAVEEHMAIAQKHDLDPVQLALAFCISRPFMTSTIIGATSTEQLATCLGAAGMTLSGEVMDDIAAARRLHPMPF